MQLHLAFALALFAPGVAAASLTGRVEGIEGAPVARARVSVVAVAGAWEPIPGETLPGMVLGSVVAGEDGAFAIEADAIPAGLHALRVESEGRLPVLMGGTRVAFGAPALPQDLRLVLTPAVTLEGLVLDASGARVAGADVRIAARSPLHASTSRATTDDEGRFRIAGLPGLTGAEIRATAGKPARRGWVLDALPLSGASRTVVEVEQGAGDEEPVGDGPVSSPRIVRGIVSSRGPDGALHPESGALVTLACDGGLEVLTATGDDGAFSVPVVSPTCVLARHGERVARSAPSAEGKEDAPLGLVLAPAPVLDVAAASPRPVLLVSDATALLTPLPRAGRLRVVLPHAGEWRVAAAEPPGESVEFLAIAGVVAPDGFSLPPPAAACVRVVDGEGRPLEGASLEPDGVEPPMTRWQWLGPVMPRAACGPDGLAQLRTFAAGETVRALVTRPGMLPATLGALASDGPCVPRTVVLRPSATLAGTVRDEAGVPVQDADVGAIPDLSRTSASAPPFHDVATTSTDVGGRFEIRGLPPGARDLVVRAEGFLTELGRRAPVELRAGETTSVEITLRRGRVIRGTVREASGKPVSLATVHARSLDQSPLADMGAAAEVDEGGHFELSGLLPAAEAQVWVHAPGRRDTEPVTVPAATDEIALSLRPVGRVEGRVVVPAGTGDALDIRVACSDSASPDVRASAQVVDGGFTMDVVEAGTYTCRADAGDAGSAVADDVVVSASETKRVTLTVRPWIVADVTVRDGATRSVLANAWVGRQRTDASGRVALRLAADTVAREPVLVGADGYVEQVLRDFSSGPREVLLEPVAQDEATSVEGVVLTADGRPADDPLVRLEGGSQSGRADTRPDGRFVVEARPGPAVIVASHEVDGREQRARMELVVPPEGIRGVLLRLQPRESGRLRVQVEDPPATERIVVAVRRPLGTGGAALVTDALENGKGGFCSASGTLLVEELEPGDYEILAGRFDEPALRRAGEAVVVAGEESQATIRLPGGEHVRGRVVEGGRAVAGARVRAFSARAPGVAVAEVPSKGDGSFSLGPLPEDAGPLLVAAGDARGGDTMRAVVRAEPGDLIELDVAGATLVGVVVEGGESGGPVAGARVVALDDGTFDAMRTAETAEDGTFEISGVVPGLAYRVLARVEGRAPVVETVTAPEAGTVSPRIVLALGDDRALAGTARDASGARVPSFTLQVVAPDGRPAGAGQVLTEADASWRLPVSVEGDVRFAARGPAWAWILGSASTRRPLVLTFGAGRVLRVVVRDQQGRSAEGARVRVAGIDGAGVDAIASLRLGETDDDGVLLVATSGVARLALEATLGGLLATGEVEVSDAGPSEIALVLRLR